MIPEDPNANGWGKSHRGRKFHYFEGRYLWNLSLCRKIHLHIGRLTLHPANSVAEDKRCKRCLRKLDQK
jgi:hypothetical protein